MTCPFPGMDPYLEPGAWPDFHCTIIPLLKANLNRAIRPRHSAFSEERLVVVEHEQNVYPDVTVARNLERAERGGVAVLDADPAIVIEAPPRINEPMRQPYIQIVDPKNRSRVITTIEVLSPDDKVGDGRIAFRAKLDECWNAGVNVVEIDLLKGGESIPKPKFARKMPPGESPFVVAVSRCYPSRYEVHRVQLRDRLPRIVVPLASDDKDVVLDLQAAFTAAWEAGAYPESLPYDRPLPGDWSDADRAWCSERLTTAGLRSAK